VLACLTNVSRGAAPGRARQTWRPRVSNSVLPKDDVMAYIAEASRKAWEVPGLPDNIALRPIRKVGIIGAGTMGGGIAMNFATAGYEVTQVETTQEALDRGLALVRANYQRSADRG